MEIHILYKYWSIVAVAYGSSWSNVEAESPQLLGAIGNMVFGFFSL